MTLFFGSEIKSKASGCVASTNNKAAHVLGQEFSDFSDALVFRNYRGFSFCRGLVFYSRRFRVFRILLCIFVSN